MTTEKRIEIAALFAARALQESFDIHADGTKRAAVCRAALAWADALAEIAEGDKPKTRYDWSMAPEGAKFATTDADGYISWWETMPFRQIDNWNCDSQRCGYVFLDIPCPDWEYSLERRPE